jgi:protein translocase SecG subunit
MLVEFLSTLFFIFNILLIILIVMQKNHGGFWSGPAGTDSMNIFGGNQGADVLQKITWAFGAVLIFGCLFLSVYQASQSQISQFYLSEIKEEITKIEQNEKTDTEENKETSVTDIEPEINSVSTDSKKIDTTTEDNKAQENKQVSNNKNKK